MSDEPTNVTKLENEKQKKAPTPDSIIAELENGANGGRIKAFKDKADEIIKARDTARKTAAIKQQELDELVEAYHAETALLKRVTVK